MSEAEETHYQVPVEHIKNARDLAQEIDLHATFIVQEVQRRGILQLTLDSNNALELASIFFQATAMLRSKKRY